MSVPAMHAHWCGDHSSHTVSRSVTLSGGIGRSMGGCGFWVQDMGGSEGLPDAGVFKRWLAFGRLSSHSRLHGSGSCRVPWLFGAEGADVTRSVPERKRSIPPDLVISGVASMRSAWCTLRRIACE
ncbi:TIM-barrel domain-containing protein, partial [Clavibacter michiganensis]|uniref:TIM-barrel domain-containing protein n=1 Tax=Clavibacter michiganensis TaxID=28447 RepID=UPI00374E0539